MTKDLGKSFLLNLGKLPSSKKKAGGGGGVPIVCSRTNLSNYSFCRRPTPGSLEFPHTGKEFSVEYTSRTVNNGTSVHLRLNVCPTTTSLTDGRMDDEVLRPRKHNLRRLSPVVSL